MQLPARRACLCTLTSPRPRLNPQDFVEYGTEAAVKEAGKYRQEGKNYIVKEGDIIFFKFNVTTDKKK